MCRAILYRTSNGFDGDQQGSVNTIRIRRIEVFMKISSITDYSTLFSGLGSSNMFSSGAGSSNVSSSIFSDYASIKNGSYGKLCKAYYVKNPPKLKAKGSKLNVTEKSEAGKMVSSAAALKSAASSLSDDKDLFKKVAVKGEDGTTKTDYDWNKITSKVKSFVDSYNDAVSKGGESGVTGVLSGTLSMVKSTTANANLLRDAGISIGEDNKLSLNTETLKSADVSALKSLFSGVGSYAYGIASNAATVQNSAANSASTYNANGGYAQTMNSIMNLYT